MHSIPFNKPFRSGHEIDYVQDAIAHGSLVGDGPYTRKCRAYLESALNANTVLLTPSGTSALEMAALLCADKERDPGEVIIPSFTFVSTANAFVLHGFTPVFVDIRESDCNIDPDCIRAAITPRTRAIVPVHYAGVVCDMSEIMAIAAEHDLIVVEDAAQAYLSRYENQFAATIGHLGIFSFHDTKNVGCGEGGALVVNDSRFMPRAEYVREKGTNRTEFLRGRVDKYTWVDVGASHLPSELQAAFLLAQLETANEINSERQKKYHLLAEKLMPLEDAGLLSLPRISAECTSNYHLLHILLDSEQTRDALMEYLKKRGIETAFHYPPLHLSPAGKRYGKGPGSLPVVESVATRLLRLPLYPTLTEREIDQVVAAVESFFGPAGKNEISEMTIDLTF